jgi:mannose/fructose/N-acetylgalactosamine-specific phosphotransferase system component IIC
MNPFSAFPPKLRAIVYWVLALFGLVVGAWYQAYVKSELPVPMWLDVAVQVAPFLLPALGFTAASNVYLGGRQTPTEEEVAARLLARRDDQDPLHER